MQAQYPCYWFGKHSPCWRYRLLAALTGIFTGLYLVASVGIGTVGGYLERPEYKLKLKWCLALFTMVPSGSAVDCASRHFSCGRVPPTHMLASTVR